MGTYFTPVVDRYSFSVSVTEALEYGVSDLCTNAERAAEYFEAAHAAWTGRYESGLVVGPANGTLTPDMFTADGLPEEYRWVADGRRWHEDIGATVDNVWFDGNSEHYGDNDRSVDIVSIREGFRMWTVDILGWGTPPSRFGVGPVTDVRVGESYVVHPGEYLVGEEFSRYGKTGAPDVVAYLGQADGWDARPTAGDYHWMGDRDSVFYALAESEGWDTSRAFARCDTCNAAWEADGGSWHFRPNSGGVYPYTLGASDPVGFDYDDTTGHDGTSVDCPACSPAGDDGEPSDPGRVFFDVY